jgi:hypothetical protein
MPSHEKPRVVPFSSPEHPALRSARLAIARHVRALPPHLVFNLAGIVQLMATGDDRDCAAWVLSAENAKAHPEQFQPTKGGA